jgi:hypothetical protein
MTAIKSLAIIALLVGGTSLAMAQNGPATGGQPPVAGGAAGEPPGQGVVPMPQSAAPAPGAPSGTRIVHRAPHARIFMQAQHVIPGCTVGMPAAATGACGTGASGGPLLCMTGQWCHYPFASACTQ